MKISKYIVAAGVFFLLAGSVTCAAAQDVTLRCMEWNIKSFEYKDNSNDPGFAIGEMMDQIKNQNAEVVFFNEFETGTGRMKVVEKLTECAQNLSMFPFFGVSYVKESGYYGNGILSKYPIFNSASKTMGRYNTYDTASDIRSVAYADILVPTAAKPEGVVVRVVVTHIETFCDTYTQVMQVKEVLDFAIKPALEKSIPVLILGDMNTDPSSEPIQEYEKIGTRLCNNTGTFMSGAKLDYFISFPQGKWSCSDYTVLKGGRFEVLSDHYPIVGTAVLKN